MDLLKRYPHQLSGGQKARVGIARAIAPRPRLLFVSHDLNVVRMLCDDLVVLEAGRVVEAGPSQAVFARPQAPYTRALLDAIPYFDPQRRPTESALAAVAE